jgi:chromate transporter
MVGANVVNPSSAGHNDGDGRPPGRADEVLLAFLKLGLTSFGGPVAHLGYFHNEFVIRRKWLDEPTYADILALCQFLPGPASSQVGLTIGLVRAGWSGALAAWCGFTLPSAIVMVLFAYGVSAAGSLADSGWLHGLKIAAVSVVAVALLGMVRTLTPDRIRATFAVVAAILVIALPSAVGQLVAIAAGALAGAALLRTDAPAVSDDLKVPERPHTGALLIAAFFVLLFGLPLLAAGSTNTNLHLFDTFYRVGSLVFGGGHVVLPLLQSELVPTGLIGNDAFLAGYGAAQAVPGPLFTFSAYVGAVIGGLASAAICLAAIYLPSFLLIGSVLPFWQRLRRVTAMQAALRGINAAVVGLLLAAFYNPVWTSAIHGSSDFALAVGAFALLQAWRTPPWLVVLVCALGGGVLGRL